MHRTTINRLACTIVPLACLAGTPAIAQQQELEDLFPTDRVIEVDIEIDEDDWDEIRMQTREFVDALHRDRQFAPVKSPYSYVMANVTIDGVRHEGVGLRKKGFIGSQDQERPSLKVKLDYTDEDNLISGVNTLTFNNNKQDRSLLSQYLTYRMFDEAGSPGSRCAFAQVTVNGRNLGVYSHVESVKRPLLKREFGNDSGVLYEGTVTDFYPEWEDSFELKTGSGQIGRRGIEQLVKAMHPERGEVLLEEGARTRILVPTDGADDGRWFLNDFEDDAWQEGTGGTGYETQKGYEGMIGTDLDVRDELFGNRGSVYVRIPFEVADTGQFEPDDDLALGMRFDDGFVAWLNGREIARANAPAAVRWDSRAVAPNSDRTAAESVRFRIDRGTSLLREGENVLAVQVMNVEPDSTDLLCIADITVADQEIVESIWKVVDADPFYRFWALEGLLSFWDGYSGNRNNFFMYLDPATGRFRFMPWGADSLFVTYGPLGEDRNSPRSVRTQGLINHHLYQDPASRRRYAAEMRILLDDHWDEEALIAETERVERMLAPHLCTSQEFQVDYEGIREFIRNRRAVVESEIAGGEMPEWSAPPAGPAFIGRGGFGQDTPNTESDPFAAAREGDLDSMRDHLAGGTDVNLFQPGRNTLMNMAAMGGHPEMVELLIRRGADPNKRNDDRGTPLHSAAFLGNTAVIRSLIAAGADLEIRNERGETPLMVASAPWSEDLSRIVEFVVAIVGLEKSVEEVQRSRPRGARMLREAGAENGGRGRMPVRGGFRNDDLRKAIRGGDPDELKAMVEASPDLDLRDGMGITPLCWAVMIDDAEIAGMLIRSGADVDGTNDDGATPLHAAAFMGRADMVALLLEAGTDTSLRNRDGRTALEGAATPWNPGIAGIIGWLRGQLRLELDDEQVRDGRRRSAELIRTRDDGGESDQDSGDSNTG